MEITYKELPEFRKSLRALYRKGGQFQKAADKVNSIIGGVHTQSMGEDPLKGTKKTKHGENRIEKCVKYDLSGYARLITIQDSGVVLFCFAGDHDTCDQWLDKKQGTTLIENDQGQIDLLPITTTPQSGGTGTGAQMAFVSGNLFEHISPEEYFDRLIDGLPRTIVRKLEQLEAVHSEPEIYQITSQIEDDEQGSAIHDVFTLLRQDRREEALNRIKVYLGEVRPIGELTEEEIRELADSKNIKTLQSDDPRFSVVFEHFVKSSNYMDWMLFLHPDQQKIVDADYKGPTKLSGVSGSGKTCIVVQRAIRLAGQYPGEKILILTLNRQLSCLISDMVDAASIPELRDSIDVMPFFKLCQGFLHQFEPENDRLYDDQTWKSKEHVDEVWREFYRCELNVHDAEVLSPLHDSLLTRSVNPETYVREEMDWLRSAVPPTNRGEYLKISRSGRGYPLEKKFRHLVVDGLSFWENKMPFVGLTDYLGLSTALYPYREKISSKYRCVIVDETQDFGTIELELIRRLAAEEENDLFFCGDVVQQVSAKHLSFKDAGVNLPSARSLKIQKNYRNSREILRAAYDVLVENITEEMMESADFEILEPEYANFSAAPPLMLRAENLQQEIAFGLQYIRDYLESEPEKKGCLALCGYSLYQIQHFGKKHGLRVLDGEITIEQESLYLSDLEHTKGFEFDVVVVVNCNEGVIPNPNKPEKERYRDLSRLYVSMTRAKDQLVLSHSTNPSEYLKGSTENFLDDDWPVYIEEEHAQVIGVPSTLNQIREEIHYHEPVSVNPLDMSGPQFLYTHHAIGLSNLLIEKLRNVISGTRKVTNGTPVEWTTLRSAKAETDIDPKARKAFGPEGLIQFRELIVNLEQWERDENQQKAEQSKNREQDGQSASKRATLKLKKS